MMQNTLIIAEDLMSALRDTDSQWQCVTIKEDKGVILKVRYATNEPVCIKIYPDTHIGVLSEALTETAQRTYATRSRHLPSISQMLLF